MTKFLRVCLFSLFALGIASCSDDTDVSSGGGATGVGTDGGNPSARFAGTYRGQITTTLMGDEIDDDTNVDDIVIVIRANGTALVTIEGESVEGEVNGNRVGFSVRIEREFGLVDCDSTSLITGDINDNRISGPVSGSGECDLLTGSTGLTLTGSFFANKS